MCFLDPQAEMTAETENTLSRVTATDLGPMGTGSNMFRTGLAHSSGIVFLGTYGPPPAIIWRFDPPTGALTKVGAPGEYQLDSMEEAPNGRVYIGTAYNGLVYELDPGSGAIRDLGSPPLDSTSWIFTMVRTRGGEVFGAKGIGLFRLDWRTGLFEAIGLVPDDHTTPGPNSSSPIVRTFEERPDGILWGDTNRWIFTLDPRTREITLVADIAALDDACYAVSHALGPSPVADLYFQVYPRFDGRVPRHMFGVCSAETGSVEFFDLPGLKGDCWVNGWWLDGGTPRWLVSRYDAQTGRSRLAVVDIDRRCVVDWWEMEGTGMPPTRLAGEGLWFISGSRGTLLRGDPAGRRLVAVAENPVPVECRCLAASPQGRLGADTYDCGFAFTFDPATRTFADHGRVWFDDHRCNYGPAAFAGRDGRYLLANHGEAMPRLWVTDVERNRHWPVGDPAVQLVAFSDGAVWGTHGPNPPSIGFDLERCWTPAWAARPGALLQYAPGAEQVEVAVSVGPVGPICEGPLGHPLCASGHRVAMLGPASLKIVAEFALPAPALAAAADVARRVSYFALADGSVACARWAVGEPVAILRCAMGFGSVERGFLVLPQSGRVVGLAADGTVSVFDPRTGRSFQADGPPPPPAGPAADPRDDAWYFADRTVIRLALS